MKLLFENWRKYLNEASEEDIDYDDEETGSNDENLETLKKILKAFFQNGAMGIQLADMVEFPGTAPEKEWWQRSITLTAESMKSILDTVQKIVCLGIEGGEYEDIPDSAYAQNERIDEKFTALYEQVVWDLNEIVKIGEQVFSDDEEMLSLLTAKPWRYRKLDDAGDFVTFKEGHGFGAQSLKITLRILHREPLTRGGRKKLASHGIPVTREAAIESLREWSAAGDC
tara:strand:- start:269 stop:949 length:681 start_codon:yes stop_codon:yes gene_type:complete